VVTAQIASLQILPFPPFTLPFPFLGLDEKRKWHAAAGFAAAWRCLRFLVSSIFDFWQNPEVEMSCF